MSFSSFLDDLMKTHGVTNVQLANAVGVSESAVKKWRKGSASPTLDNVDKISNYFAVTIDQLAGNNKKKSESNVPVIGSIRAGFPVESYEAPEGYVNTSSDLINTDNLYALRVLGDSMMPIVMEGDIIICDKASTIVNNKICVITVDGESTLKKIKKDSSGITLIPMNPLYPELHYSPKQCEEKDLHIDGVLVEMIRRF